MPVVLARSYTGTASLQSRGGGFCFSAPRQRLARSYFGSGRIERADGDVISVGVAQRKLRCSRVQIHMRLFFQPADERARPWQSDVEIVDPEEQEEAVSRPGTVRTCQRAMPVGAPRVQTEQDRAIRIDDLPEVVMDGSRLRQAKQPLVPFEALGHVSYANDRPRALHGSLRGLTVITRTAFAR